MQLDSHGQIVRSRFKGDALQSNHFQPQATLVDKFERRFSYLRLSITENCNFRCTYCLPDGSECHSHEGELSLIEIERLANAFAALGTKKIRITGGEPSLRRDLCDIISLCKSIP